MDLNILMAIRRADPEGRPWEPTEDELKAFKSWVIGRYGEKIWNEYNSNWDKSNNE